MDRRIFFVGCAADTVVSALNITRTIERRVRSRVAPKNSQHVSFISILLLYSDDTNQKI